MTLVRKILPLALTTCLAFVVYADATRAQDTRRGGAMIGVDDESLDVSLVPEATRASSSDKLARDLQQNESAVEPSPLHSESQDSEVELDSNDAPSSDVLTDFPGRLLGAEKGLLSPETISATLKELLVMSVFTLAPAILLMTTCYARFSVVFALLRQGLGAGQAPSNQVLTTLAIFLTLLVMAPVWTRAYQDAVVPYAKHELTASEALERGLTPIREFLGAQIERTGNGEMIALFMKYAPTDEAPQYYEDVPLQALAPAFLLSELKTAFLIGFQILLPFLIIDLVVSATLVATGMMMLPPAIVSLPFKLALFVMVDGWTLLVKSLLASVA